VSGFLATNGILVESWAAVTFMKGATTLIGTDIVGTGTVMVVNTNGRDTIYVAVIRGDINGDASIGVNDLAAIKSNLLAIQPLDGANKAAADIYNKGSVTVSDLLAIKKHLLSISLIVQ